MSTKKTFAESVVDVLVKSDHLDAQKAGSLKKVLAGYGDNSLAIDFLIEEGLATRAHILSALSEMYQLPFFDAEGYFFDHTLVQQVPKDVLLRNAMIPLYVDENEVLSVVAAQPDDSNLEPILSKYVSYPVQFLVGIGSDITDAVKEFYDTSVAQVDGDEDLKSEHRLYDEFEEIITEDEPESD